MINLQEYIERNNQRKTLKAAATPNWYVDVRDYPYWIRHNAEYTCPEGDDHDECAVGTFLFMLNMGHRETVKANSAFIVHARNDEVEQDIDALLAEVVRLQEYERQVDNFLTFGQGGANFTDSQWIDKLATAEQQRDILQDQLDELRGITRPVAVDDLYPDMPF